MPDSRVTHRIPPTVPEASPQISPNGEGPARADGDDAYARYLADEKANQITHGLGLTFSLAGAVVMCSFVWRHGDVWQIVGCWIFAATLVSLYAASTLSHTFHDLRRRHFFRTVDQVCIFLLIAGTYTPFALKYLRDPLAMSVLAAMWGLAFAGIACKLFYTRLKNVSTIFYVVLGWLPILAAKRIAENVPASVFLWILAGGIAYTAGTYFLSRDDRRYFHACWHLLVIAGSVCHYLAVLLFVAGWRP